MIIMSRSAHLTEPCLLHTPKKKERKMSEFSEDHSEHGPFSWLQSIGRMSHLASM
jgi:hypothetical protein